jgi:hypothetical protein
MVANIHCGKSVRTALIYNEDKIAGGQAECILASNFIKDTGQLSMEDKRWHFERLMSLHQSTASLALHLSLNFPPKEYLSNEQLRQVARLYMEKIGFGVQPYLVYRHYDAGHEHIHLLTTKVRSDGRLIHHRNLARDASRKAVREIEEQFGLGKSEVTGSSTHREEPSPNIPKIQYGGSPTHDSISDILAFVLHRYKYRSLDELNAVLRLYQVTADPGTKDSRLARYRGLYYRALDESGKKTGVPMKASDFPFKPTLDFLEKKFAMHGRTGSPDGQRIRSTLDWILLKNSLRLPDLVRNLSLEKISTVLRQARDGTIEGLTFIDHSTKTIFHGESLGNQYSASAIRDRCSFHGQFYKSPLPESRPVPEQIQEGDHFQMKREPVPGEKTVYHIPEGLLPPPVIPASPLYCPGDIDKKNTRHYLSIRI